MGESIQDIMANLLKECMPYLTSAKTGFDLPTNLRGDAAGRLQKSIDNTLKYFFNENQESIYKIIEKHMESKQ